MNRSNTGNMNPPPVHRVLEILILAVLYLATARIGQIWAVEPGNVTPVWIPSGIMLAAVLWRGCRVWPGIFIGAFFGNAWAYFSGESGGQLVSTLFAGASNGIGDSLCFIVGAYLIKRSTNTNFPFLSPRNVAFFILYGAILGSGISAVIGTTSLALANILEWNQYYNALFTWWVGDAVGVLLITPVLLYWLMKPRSLNFSLESLLYSATLIILCAFSLGLLKLSEEFFFPISILIPVVMWSIFRLGAHITFSSILVIAIFAVLATAMGYSHYSVHNLNYSLIELQIFLSTLSLTSMMVLAVLHQLEAAQIRLREANATLEAKVEQRTEELATLATTDPLTGIHNRRSIVNLLEIELTRSTRHSTAFSVLMLDLDHFKSINDQFGHGAGDRVLQNICSLFSQELRDIDFLGRLGGEEFIILLPRTSADDALRIAERIRSRIEKDSALIEPSDLTITVSIGVTGKEPGDTVENMLTRADRAMYQSKQHGRNQVTRV